MICYKPSDHVLITSNNLDFFYICYQHLLDEHFASHGPDPKYDQLVKEKNALSLLVEELSAQVQKAKPSVFSNIPGFKSNQSTDNKKEASSKDTPAKDYNQLVNDKQENEAKLQQVTQQVEQFKFKQYKLNQDFYKMRVKLYINKRVNEKRMKDMNNPGFFPSTPTNVPGSVGGLEGLGGLGGPGGLDFLNPLGSQ